MFSLLALPSWGLGYDVNGDGQVDPDDMNAVIYCIFAGDDLDPAADIDGSGVVDVVDLNLIYGYLMSNPMNLDITPYIGHGDVNGNGFVNRQDYELIKAFVREYENVRNGWACDDEAYDLNGDGKCDSWDYFIVYFLVQLSLKYDLNGDRKVDPDDVNYFIAHINDNNPAFDINDDGNIDTGDVIMLNAYLIHNPMNLDVSPYIGLGDVNGSGEINSLDYEAIDSQIVNGGYDNNWSYPSPAYDVNGDGKCDYWDYYIVYFLVQLSPKYDLNGDGKVDPDDVNYFIVHIADNNPAFDINGDGNIDTGDSIMLNACLINNPMNLDVSPYIGLGDVNGSGEINSLDYEAIDSQIVNGGYDNNWSYPSPAYDLNGDGKCDYWDYYIVYFLVKQGYTTPISTDNITFEDATTKAACVALFDTNGDGELSYREATMVTSSQLGSLSGNTNLQHFDEFQYFTGITTLPEEWLLNSGSLISITLPNGLKAVSKKAFYNCTNLERVTLPDGITRIGEGAFYNCSKLANIGLTGNSLEFIGKQAFAGCISLTSFNFDGVERINAQAFENTGLTEVTTNAFNIGWRAFYEYHPITVTWLNGDMPVDAEDNDDMWGLHLPITNPDQSAAVRVNRHSFHAAYSATETSREHLQPYIKMSANDPASDATPFSCEVPVVLPEGSKIFIVTGLDTSDPSDMKALTRYVPGNVVPANTGVIVKLPNRDVEQEQYWFLTADPSATSTADCCDNILQPAVDITYLYGDNQFFEWSFYYSNGKYSYGLITNMDPLQIDGCTAYLIVPLSQLPDGIEPYGDYFALDLTTNPVVGDVTGDNQTDVTDVNAIINIMLGKAPASAYPGNADVTGEGNIDVSDVNKVINIMLGKEQGGNVNNPVEVTYDYTSAASLQALGFAASEIPAYGDPSDSFLTKEFNDQNATMAYSNFTLRALDESTTGYVLELFNSSTASALGMGQECGKVVWTAKGSKKIKKVVVQSYDSSAASSVQITSNDTGATLTTEAALNTCTFSSSGVSSFTISVPEGSYPSTAIKTIAVTYQ